ncbi:MAG: response regulator [Spirochaetales bacterium]|nr:response regulator [Spirochaetales bacterium]
MREYAVLIADDEPVIREGLAELIRRSGLPYRVGALVSNGQKALDLMEKEHFDLIITDIEMPEMDGLAFIEKSRERDFSSRFIVLSGFDRFDYARSAYRFGVEDYLLKPVNREELYGILEKTAALLDRERPLMDVWSRFFDNPGDSGAREELDRLYREIKGWHYVILAGRRDLSVQLLPPEYLLVEEEDPSRLGLLLHDGGGEGPSLSEQLMVLGERFRTENRILSFLCGGRVLRYWDLPRSREQARELLPLLFYRGRRSLVFHGEQAALADGQIGKEGERLFTILGQAGENSLAGRPFAEDLERFEEELRSLRLRPSLFFMKLHQFLYGFLSPLEHSGLAVKELTDRFSPLFSPVESALTLEEILPLLRDFLEESGRRKRELCSSGHSALIEDILANMKENYMMDLNLQHLSEKYRINRAYLGQLFKKHTGVSFLSCLNDIRLSEACILLETTDLKVYQIAYRVGFRDPSYFMSRYEKKYGFTPHVYRKMKGKP